MGCRMSCFDFSSYHIEINKRIRMQRELANLYNDIFEREDKLIELYLKLEKLQLRHKYADNKTAYCNLEKQKTTDYETRLKKILQRRKDLLLNVIQAGIALQDSERELFDIEQKYAKIWTLTFEDDPEDKLEEWKRDLRKTCSQGDVCKVVPRPPVVPRYKYMPAFITKYSKEERECYYRKKKKREIAR